MAVVERSGFQRPEPPARRCRVYLMVCCLLVDKTGPSYILTHVWHIPVQ